ncbi:MAG: hypothetical protein LBN12_00180 [Clostridiales Family XIII bacterium]|jgi:hypothetical protein|nr:hypothetical protein [Clostridiales Family XIII bacterium]
MMNFPNQKNNIAQGCSNEISNIAEIFETTNAKFIEEERLLFDSEVSERTLCSSLSQFLHDAIKITKYKDYYVDVEYNRNQANSENRHIKTIVNEQEKIVSITCDLIIHSRGTIAEQDNSLALEMKKSTRPLKEKLKNRDRLIALTKTSYDDIWSFDGISLPEHVCGYLLGVYYEINFAKRDIRIEYYIDGCKVCDKKIQY